MNFNINERNHDDEDDFDRDDEAPRSPLRIFSALLVIGAVGGFVALAWSAYKSGMEPINEAEIPLVADDGQPIKEKPADPGGWQFDHQDKTVYNQLAAGKGSDSQPVAERIMPAPEEPVERPAETMAAPVEEVTSAPVADAPAPAEHLPATPEVVSVPSAAPQKIVETKAPVQERTVETQTVIPMTTTQSTPKEEPATAAPDVAKTVKKEPVKPAVSGNFMAQLGAFSSQSEAEKAWKKVSAAHGSKIPTKNYKVARADLGEKGVFYRLQMGPFESESAARKVCDYLKQNKQGCFIVKS